MQKQGGGGGSGASRPMPQRPRARSRSRSRSRYVPQRSDPVSPRVSLRNRSLLQQLDQKHKLRVALKLKRVRKWKINKTKKFIKTQKTP